MEYKVTLEEVLRGKLWDVVKPEIRTNIKMLLFRINYMRHIYASPFVITSGLRNAEEQKKINPKSPNSKHILGAAIDISDPDGDIHYFFRSNEDLMISVGLWAETRQGNWQHLQIYPPASGNRWFDP